MTAIKSIHRGILFLLAEWSGPAVNAHKFLVTFLQERGLSEHLVCVNVDNEPDIYDLPEFSEKVTGWGEAAIVKDGKIDFTIALGKDLSRIQDRCEELLTRYFA